jgi:hypothetical protein
MNWKTVKNRNLQRQKKSGEEKLARYFHHMATEFTLSIFSFKSRKGDWKKKKPEDSRASANAPAENCFKTDWIKSSL